MLEGKFEREEKIEKTWGGTISIDLFIDHGKKEVRIFDSYDKSNNLTAIVEPGNRLTSFEYDRMGRVKKMVFPDGSFESHSFGALGNIKVFIDVNGTKKQLLGYRYRHDFEAASSPMNTSPRPAARSLAAPRSTRSPGPSRSTSAPTSTKPPRRCSSPSPSRAWCRGGLRARCRI